MKWLFGIAAACGVMALGSHRMAEEEAQLVAACGAAPIHAQLFLGGWA